jgi:altronate hydrolase
MHAQDNVAVAMRDLTAGDMAAIEPGHAVGVRQPIPAGHKVALLAIAAGEPVRRYGEIIGFAARGIAPGEHVHTHNVALREFDREMDPSPLPTAPQRSAPPRTFLGYARPDGRAGTRNYIAVIATVHCSAHTCREIARHFTRRRMAAFPNVDGVIAITHNTGCTIGAGGQDYVLLQRTLAGIARHPNVAASVIVGLGCEVNRPADLIRNQHLCEGANAPCPATLVIQELGGIRKTVQAGIEAVSALLPAANACRRTPQPLSALTLALQCGGSDAWSGVTANPVLGLVSDEIVGQGGTVVLAETPEIYGAEHLLARRAASPKVRDRLFALVREWEEYARRMDVQLDSNRTAGNMEGGLTTIYEKSLGAIAKAGSTPLQAVLGYAEPVSARGLVFMDSPGFDSESVTGQVAAGCNLVAFTTGRGSVFGFRPAPVVKVASNSSLFRRMADDMDFDAGRVLEGTSLEIAASELLHLLVAVASGKPSRSEAQGVGEAEFSPWQRGGRM